MFSKASNLLLAVLLTATFSIPISAALKPPFVDENTGTLFTGLSMATLRENLMPHFTKNAAGGHGHRR